jgi:hypothetical protein
MENNGNRHEWIEIIMEIYHCYEKSKHIRIECLALFTNMLLVLSKNELTVQKKMGVGGGLLSSKYRESL